MASLVAYPGETSPGVIVFTTAERDTLIARQPALRRKIESIKPCWLVGLHHNWHDERFRYDPLFDFSMAGEADLTEQSGRAFPLVPLDACNFAPDCFHPGAGEPFWDILYVARAVKFKRIPEFFACVRKLYDAGRRDRVLFLCPMPPYERQNRDTILYEIRELYDSLFQGEEQDRFTLLTLEARYPFPFDLETLSHFYRSSRVFVHFADDERRCRVAAYAWATGLPVVGMSCIASLLPEAMRQPPYYFGVDDDDAMPARIVEALESRRFTAEDVESAQRVVSSRHTRQTLIAHLAALFPQRSLGSDQTLLSLEELDIRLGRHHSISHGPNRVDVTLDVLLDAINDDLILDELKTSRPRDPERALEALLNPATIKISEATRSHWGRTWSRIARWPQTLRGGARRAG